MHDVLELVVRILDSAADDVVPGGDALVRHAEADRTFVLVRLPRGDELVGNAAAVVHPVELERERAVPVDPEPAERLLDLVDRLGDLAARVGVLDPEPDLAALMPGEEPVEEDRADAADVEEAGGAGSHPDDRTAMRIA